MTSYPPVVYDAATKTHRPLGAGEAVDAANIPLSSTQYNGLKVFPDGLYTGPSLNSLVYYVANEGTDDPAHGTEAAPFKTLDYVISYITNQDNGQYRSGVTIALKAGETFVGPVEPLACYGDIHIAFFGDPKYGDFNSPLVNGTTAPADMADLQRPIINVQLQTGLTGQSGILLISSPRDVKRQVTLEGIQINLASGPHITGAVDFITGFDASESRLLLLGTVVNITDPTSPFGLYGLTTRCLGGVYQRCSQFWVAGAPVTNATSTVNLAARNFFFKFYPEYPGNQEQGLDLYNGVPGSSLMTLSWSDVPSAPVGASSSLGTFPTLQDPNYGLANYFFNLTRDQQGRPLNVLSGRLF